MGRSVRVLDIDEHRFAVEVREEGDLTARHCVTVPDSLLHDLVLPDIDRERLVAEAVNYLLQREPELPADIDLVTVEREDPSFLEELRARLGGRPLPPEI